MNSYQYAIPSQQNYNSLQAMNNMPNYAALDINYASRKDSFDNYEYG